MSTEMDQTKLTAYALGELPAGECAEIEAHLQRSAADQKFVDDMREMAGSVRHALQNQPQEHEFATSETQHGIIARAPFGGPFDVHSETARALVWLAVAGFVFAVFLGLLLQLARKPDTAKQRDALPPPHIVDRSEPKTPAPEKTLVLPQELKELATTGTVTGIVKFVGNIPRPKVYAIPPKDRDGCKCGEVESEEIVVDPDTRGLKWASVRIMNVKAPDMPELADVQIDQKGCRFSPHVVVVAPGARVTVINPDRIAHNVHTTPFDASNTALNRMMLPTDPEISLQGGKFFSDPEVIKLQCDIHPWMSGFIVVHDPRYAAVTGRDGKFSIAKVPPGEYEVIVFHELGERRLNVKVQAGEVSKIEAVFSLR